MRRLVAAPGVLLATIAALAIGVAPAASQEATPFTPERTAAPIILTGDRIPEWSRLAAQGVADPTPGPGLGELRSAHNGTITVPPDVRTGVPVDEIAAFAWTGSSWREVPVQIDERYPYFLANGRSDFGIYSGTDPELTYAWNPDAHSVGEESWKMFFGQCSSRYPTEDELDSPLITPGLGESAADYLAAMPDPVPGLDDDDEIVLDAADAGGVAPDLVPAPVGADPFGQRIDIVDPASGDAGAIYLFRVPGGSSFTWADSAVQLTWDEDAYEYLDRFSFADDDPEKLGTSNRGYGANLPGTVCDPGGAVRDSDDRFPRHGMTVTTPTYELYASGRWMVRSYRITAPGTEYDFGPDLVDRWKGRAFQQSPDSQISVVGFEDEQVNWEANASLLGWKAGPVRAIREVWGADSGTNVTKTEYFYRSADVFRYHVRVHPIPSDGLYTSWDYNLGVADTYYDLVTPDGVPIDGINDDTGNVDAIPVPGGEVPAYFDVVDPTAQVPSAILRPEEVAGRDGAGAMVYVFEFNNAQSLFNPAVVPYYRDDACLDDGTGDDPVARPWPGEASTDDRVKDGYAEANGAPYDSLVCDPANGSTPFQGAIASHGIHFFATHDSDNVFTPLPLTEIDGQQWRFAVPMQEPTNVLLPYGQNVQLKWLTPVTPYTADEPPTAAVPEVPAVWLVPLAGVVTLGVIGRRRRID